MTAEAIKYSSDRFSRASLPGLSRGNPGRRGAIRPLMILLFIFMFSPTLVFAGYQDLKKEYESYEPPL
ncbi:MAG: hypothetical protein GY859_37310, partial [Desulfobacterales bacterium]|nr:hypothetical protein [Desulfobacterales bacterium]